jgi:acyl-coenzyme A synthetase/AMP-(fatty) acid ligase
MPRSARSLSWSVRASDGAREVTAFVVAKRAVDPHELLQYAARRFVPYKVPKQVVFAYWLPRNAWVGS